MLCLAEAVDAHIELNKCPHCGKIARQLTSLYERLNEGLLNACENCKYEGKNLRDVIDLKAAYKKYNQDYFDNRLPEVEFVDISWNTRLRIGGRCFFDDRKIELGLFYLNKHPDEFESIFVHEMIHLLTPYHGIEFKREADRISTMGLPISIYTKYSERRPFRWKYICIKCGREYKKRKRISSTCCCSKCYTPLKEFPILKSV